MQDVNMCRCVISQS